MSEKILKKNQRFLVQYLTMSGYNKIEILTRIAQLWEERAVIAMAHFCKENPEASPMELYEASSKISLEFPSKYEKETEEEN